MGTAAGITTWRQALNLRAPSTLPARSHSGGMWSTPLISPLAIEGAAPSTTTKKIAVSLNWKSRIASGNQTIEGMVWRAAIIEPIARRSSGICETAKPTTVPITRATANPSNARRIVVATPSQNSDVVTNSPSVANT